MSSPPGRRGRLRLFALFAPVPGSRPAAVGGLVNGVAVALPLLAGIAAGDPGAGAWACLGGYLAAFTNKGGPRGRRTLALVTAALADAAAFAAGELVTGLFPLALVLLGALVFLAGLGDAVHPAVGRLGTMPTTALVAGSAAAAAAPGSGRTALLVLCGGLWYAAATALITPPPRLRDVLARVAEPYRETGRHLTRIAAGTAGTPEDYARTAASLDRAGAAVRSLHGEGGDDRLAALLDPLVGHATALADLTRAVHATGPPPAGTAEAFDAATGALAGRIARLAGLLTHRRGSAPAGPDPHPALAGLDAACDALRPLAATGQVSYQALSRAGHRRRLLARIADEADLADAVAAGLPVAPGDRARPAPGPRPAFDRARLRAALAPDSAGLRHALRTAVVACGVFALVRACGLGHGEWAVLAVLRVLRPRYGDTLERAWQRTLGNLVGGTCAALLIMGVREPVGLAAALCALIVLGFTVRPVNYAFWVVFGTPLVLLLGDVSHPGDWRSALARIAMTLLGSAAALLGGYLLWPTWEQGRLAARAEEATAAAAAHLDSVLGRLLAPPPAVGASAGGRTGAGDPVRTAAERALAALRDAEQQARREPHHDSADVDRAAATADTLYDLALALAALAAHPPPAVPRIPALAGYAAHAAPALTARTADERRERLAGLADALEEMRLYMEELHVRRQRELAAGRSRAETPARVAVREDGPVVELLAGIARRIGELPPHRP
ncbi:FUSC family protein [Streptomyces sp. NPDC089919]|uniref:FUSC family protein n=1 Tax=Streptomyces sp. NPDC089919 TaxID=3155188 RepID=UPI0034494BAF